MQKPESSVPSDHPKAFRVLVFASIGHVYAHLFMVLYPTVVLSLEANFDMTYGELITLALGGYILFGAAALPAGWLGDRWSGRGMMAVMFFGLGIASIATGFSSSPLQIGFGLAAIGAFAAIYHPVGISMVVRYARRRGQALGVNGIFGGIGVALGALAAGIFSDLVSWRAAFIVPGIISLLTGIAYLALVPGVKLERAPTETEIKGSVWQKGYSVILLGLAIIIVASSCAGLIFQSTSVALPKIFVTRLTFLDGAVLGVGGLVAVVYLFGSCGQLVGGWLSDTYSLRRVFFLAFVFHVPLLLLGVVATDWAMVILALCLVSVGSSIQPVADSLVANYVPSTWHSRAYGARFVSSFGISACSIPLVAVIFDLTESFVWLFFVMSFLAIFAMIITLFLPPDRSITAYVITKSFPSTATAVDG